MNTASLVDLPRCDKLTTWMGHETVKEKDIGQTGTLRGKGGKIERVTLVADVDVDVDVDGTETTCVVCCVELYMDLLLLVVLDI